ncbi:MAG: hypothetical protein IPO91_30315 [Chloroflexi bacterium]|nr:hypothetical protein [Chloroflexota bacterium]
MGLHTNDSTTCANAPMKYSAKPIDHASRCGRCLPSERASHQRLNTTPAKIALITAVITDKTSGSVIGMRLLPVNF